MKKRTAKTPRARRRNPITLVVLLFLALAVTGTAYAAVKPTAQADVPGGTAESTEEDVTEGERLFLANCASCHGISGEGNRTSGPPLVGAGYAAVDFQVSTGRMPMAQPGVQAPRNDYIDAFDAEQIHQLSSYVASLGPGPDMPEAEWLDPELGDPANGGKIFRTNCAMCHNSSGSGGALTRGKYAPSLMDVEEKDIYNAMLTGPQSMPVFNDDNLTPQEKRDVIAFLKFIEGGGNNYGGQALGSLGPAGDGLFVWTFGVALLIAAAVWVGRKAA